MLFKITDFFILNIIVQTKYLSVNKLIDTL